MYKRQAQVIELTADAPVAFTVEGGTLVVRDTLQPGRAHVFQLLGPPSP